jgi:hypothetical protein
MSKRMGQRVLVKRVKPQPMVVQKKMMKMISMKVATQMMMILRHNAPRTLTSMNMRMKMKQIRNLLTKTVLKTRLRNLRRMPKERRRMMTNPMKKL